MASRQKGKGNKKPTKKKLTKAQLIERKYISAYNAAEKRWKELYSKGFIDPQNKFSDEYGRFSVKKPKNPTEASLRAISKYTKDYFYKQSRFVIPSTGKEVSGTYGRKYLSEQKIISREQTLLETGAQTPITRTEYNKIIQGLNANIEISAEPIRYTPRPDMFRQIEWMIRDLPEGKWVGKGKWVDYEPIKKQLIDTLYTKVEEVDDDAEYEKYLESHKAEIEDALDGIVIESDQPAIDARVAIAEAIISREPLSEYAAKRIES